VIRGDKRGYIPGETPQILERLNIDPEQFIATGNIGQSHSLGRLDQGAGRQRRLHE